MDNVAAVADLSSRSEIVGGGEAAPTAGNLALAEVLKFVPASLKIDQSPVPTRLKVVERKAEKRERMTNKEYREHEGISKSALWEIRKSPLHFKWKMEHPQEDTPALIFGRAVHKWVLEEETFFDEFAVAPIVDKRTKDGKELWASFELSAAGKDLIKAEDFEIIKAMKNELLKNEMAVNLLAGKKETSLFGTDELTGERIKARPDILTEIGDTLIVADYKSCVMGNPKKSAAFQMENGTSATRYACIDIW